MNTQGSKAWCSPRAENSRNMKMYFSYIDLIDWLQLQDSRYSGVALKSYFIFLRSLEPSWNTHLNDFTCLSALEAFSCNAALLFLNIEKNQGLTSALPQACVHTGSFITSMLTLKQNKNLLPMPTYSMHPTFIFQAFRNHMRNHNR